MKKYFAIYRKLLEINLTALLAYRTNFINSMISSMGWGFFSLYSIILLTSRVREAYGLQRSELLLFNGMYGVLIGFFHMILSVNMRRFSRVIHYGELDLLLSKPIDAQFAVSLWLIDYTMILRILIGLGYTVWLVWGMGLDISLTTVVAVLLLGVCSLLILYSLWFLMLTTLIWFTNLSNLVVLLFSFESIARFPREMLQQLTSILFFIVFPLTLVINTPAHLMLGRVHTREIVELVLVAMGLFVIARRFWIFALSRYTSASS